LFWYSLSLPTLHLFLYSIILSKFANFNEINNLQNHLIEFLETSEKTQNFFVFYSHYVKN